MNPEFPPLNELAVQQLLKVKEEILAKPSQYCHLAVYQNLGEECGSFMCIAGWICVHNGFPPNEASMTKAARCLGHETDDCYNYLLNPEISVGECGLTTKELDIIYAYDTDPVQRAHLGAKLIDHFIKERTPDA